MPSAYIPASCHRWTGQEREKKSNTRQLGGRAHAVPVGLVAMCEGDTVCFATCGNAHAAACAQARMLDGCVHGRSCGIRRRYTQDMSIGKSLTAPASKPLGSIMSCRISGSHSSRPRIRAPLISRHVCSSQLLRCAHACMHPHTCRAHLIIRHRFRKVQLHTLPAAVPVFAGVVRVSNRFQSHADQRRCGD